MKILKLNGVALSSKTVSNMKLVLEENKAELFTFTMNQDCEYINKITPFKDVVEILNIDSKGSIEHIKTVRIIDFNKKINSDGTLVNDVTCEGLLNYLCDTITDRNEYFSGEIINDENSQDSIINKTPNMTVYKLFSKLITEHNLKVSDDRKFYLGNIDESAKNIGVNGVTDYNSTLNSIYNLIINPNGGFLTLSNKDNKLYINYSLTNPNSDTNLIELGLNLKDLDSNHKIENFCTKLIGIGKDNKLISTYSLDSDIAKFGLIEKKINYNDISNQDELDIKVKLDYENLKNNSNIAKVNILDLSYIKSTIKPIRLSQMVLINCEKVGYSFTHRVIKLSIDFDKPYLSTFELNSKQVSQINITDDIVHGVENNKIEILKTGDKIFQKVSKNEFATYKEQTATTIKNTVSKDDFKTLFQQSIEGFDFTIGTNTPLSIRQDELLFKFSDGTTCTMDKRGFTWNKGGVSYPYHSCIYRGVINGVNSGDVVRAYLPDYMKGKKVEWGWQNGNVLPENNTDLLFSFNVEDVTKDLSQSNYKDFKVSLMVRNPKTENTPSWRGRMNIIYTIIG